MFAGDNLLPDDPDILDELQSSSGSESYHSDVQSVLFSSDDDGSDEEIGVDEEEHEEGFQEDQPEIFHNDDVSIFAAQLLLDLRAKANMTESMVKTVINRTQQLIDSITLGLRRETEQIFINLNLQRNHQVQQLLHKFTTCKPFKKMRSSKGQESAFRQYFNYLPPSLKQLPGVRHELRLSREGEYVQVPVRDTYSYISPIRVIEMVLQHEEIRNFIETESYHEEDGVLNNFRDGSEFPKHPFLSRYPNALRINLYGDGIETANALGSRKLIHKLYGFQISFQNFPKTLQSKLGSKFLTILAYEQDVRRYGFKEITKELIADLKSLESEEGVEIVVNGQVTRIHAVLVPFCGDSEAVHEVFGLLGSGANHFCRLCLISRQELHGGEVFIGERRNRVNHAEQLAHVQRNPAAASLYGLRENSVLNELRFFHTTECYVFDLMHDILRGTATATIKLVLGSFVVGDDPLITVQELNERINSFAYGYSERRDKPSSNLTVENLTRRDYEPSQKAVQMWCLIRVLPFLIDDRVPKDDPRRQFLLLFLRIMAISYSPRLNLGHVAYLHTLQEEHLGERKQLFPNVDAINKDHHLKHHPECIEKFGPLVNYDCLGFERFHNQMRKRAAVCCNFKNIAFTISKTCQLYQCAVWSGRNPEILKKITSIVGAVDVEAHSLDFFDLLLDVGVVAEDIVTTAKSLCVFGTSYRPGVFIVIDGGSNDVSEEPTFGLIKCVLLVATTPYAIVSAWETVCLDPDFNAYEVENECGDNELLICLDTLIYPRTLSKWKPIGSNTLYLCPRHIIF